MTHTRHAPAAEHAVLANERSLLALGHGLAVSVGVTAAAEAGKGKGRRRDQKPADIAAAIVATAESVGRHGMKER